MDATLPHTHSHSAFPDVESLRSEKNLKIAFVLTLIILVTEFTGGVISKSMALYSDSGHILVDASSLLLAWFAQVQIKRTPTEKNTYGFHRIGILAALLNASLLFLIAGVIIYESYERLIHPEMVNSTIMIIFSSLSFIVNIIIGFKIHKDIKQNLNIKSAFFHIIGDASLSLSIIAAGLIIYFTGFYYVDPVVSLIVSPVIALGALTVIKETLNILLEAVPEEVNFAAVKSEMLKISGVEDVHDLHIWSMSKSFVLLTAHILVNPEVVKSTEMCCVINTLQEMLENKFNINHAVIQPEFTICDMGSSFCVRHTH